MRFHLSYCNICIIITIYRGCVQLAGLLADLNIFMIILHNVQSFFSAPYHLYIIWNSSSWLILLRHKTYCNCSRLYSACRRRQWRRRISTIYNIISHCIAFVVVVVVISVFTPSCAMKNNNITKNYYLLFSSSDATVQLAVVIQTIVYRGTCSKNSYVILVINKTE